MSGGGKKNGTGKMKLTELLGQVGMPTDSHVSAADLKERKAKRIARRIAEIYFAQHYVKCGFSHVKAYLALRPETSPDKAKRRGQRWIHNPRVLRALAGIIGEDLENTIDERKRLLQGIRADIDSEVFDYLEQGQVPIALRETVQMIAGTRFNIDKSRYSDYQRKAVRGITIRNGVIEKIELVDRQRAQQLYAQILDVFDQLKASMQGNNTMSGALRARIARAKELQVSQARRLAPPLNVREFKIVEKPAAELVPGVPKNA